MSKPQAMIIEDDYDAATIMSEALLAADYEVIVFRDGDSAREGLRKHTPYLITLDLHLPGTGGESLLEEIRSDERFSETQVMLITADDRTASYVGEKATLVLLKPVSFTQLRVLAQRLAPA